MCADGFASFQQNSSQERKQLFDLSMGGNNTKVLDQTDKPVVLVIGGGFGGVECAKAVEKKTNCALFDRKDYFFHNVGALR